MNTNKSKAGNRKLLAALAVFAMVACVFAAIPMGADEADAGTRTTADTNDAAGMAVYDGTAITAGSPAFVKKNTTIATLSTTSSVTTLYLEKGASVTITASDASQAVEVHIAESTKAGTTSGKVVVTYYPATKIELVTAAASDVMTIRAADDGMTYSATTSTAGDIFPFETDNAKNALYNANTVATSTAATFYANDYTGKYVLSGTADYLSLGKKTDGTSAITEDIIVEVKTVETVTTAIQMNGVTPKNNTETDMVTVKVASGVVEIDNNEKMEAGTINVTTGKAKAANQSGIENGVMYGGNDLIYAPAAASNESFTLANGNGTLIALPNTTLTSAVKVSNAGKDIVTLPAKFATTTELTIAVTNNTNVKITSTSAWTENISFADSVVALTSAAADSKFGAFSAGGATLTLDGQYIYNFFGNLTVNSMTLSTAVPLVNLYAKNVTISGTSGNTLVVTKGVLNISKDTNVSVTGNVAITASQQVNVLGTISANSITDGDCLYTADGTEDNITVVSDTPAVDAIVMTVKKVAAATADSATIGDVTYSIDDAVAIGFPKLTATASVAITEDLTMDADLDLNGKTFTVNDGVTFTNKGKIYDDGANATVVITVGSSNAGGAMFINDGEIVGGTKATANVASINVMTGTVDNKNTFTNNKTITNTKVIVNDKAVFINKGTMTMVNGDSTNYNNVFGQFENSKGATITMDGATLNIGNDTYAVEFENHGTITMGTGSSIAVNATTTKDSKLVNNGAVGMPKDADAEISGNGEFINGKNGEVGVKVSTAKISGTSYTVEMKEHVTQHVTYMSLQNVVVPEGAVLEVRSQASMTVNGTLTIYGTLIIHGELYIDASSSDAYAAAAKMIVNGKLDISKNGKVIIGSEGNAKATVSEGASIVAAENAKVSIGTKGTLNVEGTIEMQKGSYLAGTISVATTGTANLNGYFGTYASSAFSEPAILNNAGNVLIDNGENEVRTVVEAQLTNAFTVNMAADAAKVTIVSYLYEGAISVTDTGLVTYDYSENAEKNGKVDLEVDESNDNTVSITLDIVTAEVDKVKKLVLDGEIVIVQSASSKPITDAKAEESGLPANVERSQTYSMDVSGSISEGITYEENVEEPASSFALEMIAGTDKIYKTVTEGDANYETVAITVNGELVAGAQTEIEIGGTVNVAGEIDGIASEGLTNGGVLTVTGLIALFEQIAEETGSVINAVYYDYTVMDGKDKITTHYYTTLNMAIAGIIDTNNISTNDVATIMGTAYVLKDTEVPDGVDIVFSDDSDKLFVGKSNVTEIVMTMKNGAELSSSSEQIEVFATLTFENQSNDGTVDTISDVVIASEDPTGFKTYTNIYSAVKQAAESGEESEVVLTRAPGSYVVLTQNLTIPSNVTLVIDDASHVGGLILMDGVTLTIDGAVESEQDILAQTRFADKAMNVDSNVPADVKKSSAIVVNGVLRMSEITGFTYADGKDVADEDKVTYNGEKYVKLSTEAPVFGAYFQTDKWFVISNVEYAMENTKDVISVNNPTDKKLCIFINGPVEAGDVVFNVGDAPMVLQINDKTIAPIEGDGIETSLTASSVTLGKDASIYMAGAFNGNIVVGDAQLEVAKVKALTVANIDDEMVLIGTADAADKESVLSVATGSVELGTAGVNGKAFAFTGNNSTAKYSENVWFNVAEGATAVVANTGVINQMFITGTVEIPAGLTLNVTEIVVYGTADIANVTDISAAGKLVATKAWIGIELDDIKMDAGAVATVSGPIAADFIYVIEGADVHEESLAKMESTVFYIEDAPWFTAYAKTTGQNLTVTKTPVENADLEGWYQTETDKDTNVTIGAQDKVTAILDYDIYKIFVIVNPGFGNVYIDNQQMDYGMLPVGEFEGSGYKYGYFLNVAAGEHKITYDLENGWSGEAKMTVNGEPVLGGLGFTTSGTGEDDRVYTIQLSGLEKSGYVEPTEPSDDKEEMGLTDYLLIVLVVLVVVLAVLVAVRMMRS